MMTLEMPAASTDTDLSVPFDPDTALNTVVGTAETAADLLERGEAEGGTDWNNDGDEPGGGFTDADKAEFPPADGQPQQLDPFAENSPDGDVTVIPEAAAPETVESNGHAEPEKKKRIRKPKADKIELSADPAPAAAELNSPAVVAQLAKIETSRSTRAIAIHNIEQEFIAATLEITHHEDVIEHAKSQIKTLTEHQKRIGLKLRELRSAIEWQPELPLGDQSNTPPAAAVEGSADAPGCASPCSTAAVAESVSSTTPPVPTDFYPDAWRSASIDELELPAKLAEKLVEDGRDTIGRLEDLRAEISQGHAKWPKGIGQAKITLIEDAQIKWLTANRDSQVFSETQQSADTHPAISDGEHPTPPQPVENQSPSGRPAAVSEQTDDESDTAIIARAAALNNGKANCLAPAMPTDKCWRSGYEQYGVMIEGREQELIDCPYIPGEEQDDWLRGFMAAKALKDYPDAEVKGKAAAASQASAVVFNDLDDI